ncbi:MAG: diaminopimelate epimerase [Daejeonella sp.]
MELQFFKYEGAGNDFIMIDNREGIFDHSRAQLIERLCNRRFGIGADGIMCIEKSETLDFEMIYYNSDGRKSSMCGNGGRCIVAFAQYLKIINTETTFMAVDGPHYAKISENGDWVSLQMIDVDQITKDADAYVLDTGSPHYVSSVKDLKHVNVVEDGKSIRYNDTYKKKGININFVEDFGSHYFVRTYERGVEDETYACGTGVTAVALAMAKEKGLSGQINTEIHVLGGELNVRFDYDGQKFSNIFLEGPATYVYSGKIFI